MAEKRKDNKGRASKVGESQLKNRRYKYRYTDTLGKRNPTARALNQIEGQQKRKEALTKEEENALLDFTQKNFPQKNFPEVYKKIVILLDTMCRISEFARLT